MGKKKTCFCFTDWKKIQNALQRSLSEEYLISLALKRHLSDKGTVLKQIIWSSAINIALRKLLQRCNN